MTATLAEGDAAPRLQPPGDAAAHPRTPMLAPSWCIYFYPKDDTSGCTKEAIDFNALANDFAAAETEISACRRTHLPATRSSRPSTSWI